MTIQNPHAQGALVIAALAKVGLRGGTWEFPGFILIDGGDGAEWSFGTANGPWGATFTRDGHAVGGFETDAAPFDDPDVIAQKLLAGWRAAQYEE